MSDAYKMDNLFQNKHDGLFYENQTVVPFSGTVTSGLYRNGVRVSAQHPFSEEAASLMALHPLAKIGTL